MTYLTQATPNGSSLTLRQAYQASAVLTGQALRLELATLTSGVSLQMGRVFVGPKGEPGEPGEVPVQALQEAAQAAAEVAAQAAAESAAQAAAEVAAEAAAQVQRYDFDALVNATLSI